MSSRTFLEACGAAEAVVLDIEGPEGSAVGRRSFTRPAIRIGSHPDADLVLEHPEVSRRHAYLQVVGGRLFCIDLGSRSGAPTGWVDPLEPVGIGPFRIRAWIGSGEPAEGFLAEGRPAELPSPLSSAYARRHELPEATLAIQNGGATVLYPVTRVLTLIGRDPLCKLRFEGSGSSRFSAALVRTTRGPWLVDLLSSAGVTVDGRRVSRACLRDGGSVQVGRHRLQVRVAALEGDRSADALPAVLASPGSGAVEVGYRVEPLDLDRGVLAQVTQMHQQVCDQFQQAILMMTQLFGGMHGDHMKIIREELEQIRELTREIQAIRAASPGVPPRAPEGGEATAAPASAAPAALPDMAPSGDRTRRVRHDPREIDAMVGERLARYEAERQTRYDKILRILMGR